MGGVQLRLECENYNFNTHFYVKEILLLLALDRYS